MVGKYPPQKLHPPKKARGAVDPSLPGSPESPLVLLFLPLGCSPRPSRQPQYGGRCIRLTDSGGFSSPPCEGLSVASSGITAEDPSAASGRGLWEGSLGTHFWFFTIKGLGKLEGSVNDLALNPGYLGDLSL